MDQGVATAVELLEDLFLFGGRDADALVAYFQLHRAVGAVQTDADELLVLRILQRVVHKIQKRARDRFAVDADRWNVSRDVFLKRETVLFALEAVGIERGANKLRQIGFLELILLAAGLNARKVEDVVDESA